MYRLILLFLVISQPLIAEPLKVPGGEFDIEWKTPFSQQEKATLISWLEHAATSASLINGSFPRKQTHVLIQRASRGTGPVPWANTIRHTEPQGVSFHVNPTAGLEALKADWTATHEFSHLYLPYPGRSDIWISEGFASYYQNIFMMRKGTLSEVQGWQKIADGFARGQADLNQDISLQQVSREMRSRRAFKRVYWSGAHYFLEADIALRQQSSSLDEVISKFMTCCREHPAEWDGAKIVEALDKALDPTGTTRLFTPLYRQYQQSMGLPDYRSTLTKVGVLIADKQISLSPESDTRTALRQAISSRP
tara:strand:+ start:165 stop:1088 length:924 start_codon:yes stop_codon:yes gene_type:complete